MKEYEKTGAINRVFFVDDHFAQAIQLFQCIEVLAAGAKHFPATCVFERNDKPMCCL